MGGVLLTMRLVAGTTDRAVAALVTSLYPIYPVEINDNAFHLQIFRHLWVIAVEHRCLSVYDAVTGAHLLSFECVLFVSHIMCFVVAVFKGTWLLQLLVWEASLARLFRFRRRACYHHFPCWRACK